AATADGATCKTTFYYYDVRDDLGLNSLAGQWKVAVWARAADGVGRVYDHAAGTVDILRKAKLTANATPEPARKNKTLTVTGVLSQLDWASDSGAYTGFGGRWVRLEFRKKGTSTYKTVKSFKTSSTGALKATVTAKYDGYWRFVFPGASTTTPA